MLKIENLAEWKLKQGVYAIRNKLDQKIYVGSAVFAKNRSLYYRIKKHIYQLNKGNHYNRHLQRAWNKYGADNFEFLILEQVFGDKQHLLEREQFWIDELEAVSQEFGYNNKPFTTNNVGIKWSEESKKKVSGKNHHFFGKRHTEEAKRKCGEINIGTAHHCQKHSEEAKKKMSDFKKISSLGKGNPFYGKKHSEETKRKISEKQKLRLAKRKDPANE